MSHNSNSFRSHSLNTCSSIVSATHFQQQQQQQQRYPVVVSFRKIPARQQERRQQQIRVRTHTLDSDYVRTPVRLSVNETYNPAFEPSAPRLHSVSEDRHSNDDFIVPIYYQKLYGSNVLPPNTGHPFFKAHKRIYNSPYDSPEMTQDSIMLEQNLNKILQELVFKSDIYDRQSNGQSSISKSRSVPCFFQNG